MIAQMLILTALLATSPTGRQASAPARPSSNTPDDRLASVPAPAMVTVEGCVATAREVHGGSTNLAERIGLDDGFRLTSPRIVKGRAPAGALAAKPAMFAIVKLRDEQLKPHLGRRVRIEGSLAVGEAPSGDGKPALAALTARTVRQVAGDCPLRSRSDED